MQTPMCMAQQVMCYTTCTQLVWQLAPTACSASKSCVISTWPQAVADISTHLCSTCVALMPHLRLCCMLRPVNGNLTG